MISRIRTLATCAALRALFVTLVSTPLCGIATAQIPAAPAVTGASEDVGLRTDPTKIWATNPTDIAFKPVDFYSEGVRLSGQVIYAAKNEGRRLPTIVSATGWGGQANSFRAPATELARAGYAVFLFDYRGGAEATGVSC